MPIADFQLTTPDTIVFVVCAIFALRGGFKGFVWQAVRTAGLLGGLWAATRWNEPFGEWLNEHVSALPDGAVPAVAWVIIAVGVFFIVSIFAQMARGFVRERELTGVDRLLGLALGAATGLVLCTLVFSVWGSFRSNDDNRATLQDSYSARYMAKTVEVVTPFVPETIRHRWSNVFRSIPDAFPSTDPR